MLLLNCNIPTVQRRIKIIISFVRVVKQMIYYTHMMTLEQGPKASVSVLLVSLESKYLAFFIYCVFRIYCKMYFIM